MDIPVPFCTAALSWSQRTSVKGGSVSITRRHSANPRGSSTTLPCRPSGAIEEAECCSWGLGTGLGTALIVNGVLEPLELAHLPYRKGRTFEEYVGQRALDRLGKKKWRRAVTDVVQRLRQAVQADYVVLGGGNVKHLNQLPDGVRRGTNANAHRGGMMLWTNSSRH